MKQARSSTGKHRMGARAARQPSCRPCLSTDGVFIPLRGEAPPHRAWRVKSKERGAVVRQEKRGDYPELHVSRVPRAFAAPPARLGLPPRRTAISIKRVHVACARRLGSEAEAHRRARSDRAAGAPAPLLACCPSPGASSWRRPRSLITSPPTRLRILKGDASRGPRFWGLVRKDDGRPWKTPSAGCRFTA